MQRHRSRRRRAGRKSGRTGGLAERRAELAYSLVELLIVLGMLALLAAWAYSARPSDVGRAAAALRSQFVQARLEAAQRNEPVAVVYEPAQHAFVTRALGAGFAGGGCGAGAELFRVDLGAYRRVSVTGGSDKGLVWLPDGRGRTCDGGGAFNQTIELADPIRDARLIVSRAGRVRIAVEL